jgi:hypothetical protein
METNDAQSNNGDNSDRYYTHNGDVRTCSDLCWVSQNTTSRSSRNIDPTLTTSQDNNSDNRDHHYTHYGNVRIHCLRHDSSIAPSRSSYGSRKLTMHQGDNADNSDCHHPYNGDVSIPRQPCQAVGGLHIT